MPAADDLFFGGILVGTACGVGFLLWYMPIIGVALVVFLLTTGYLTFRED